MKSSFLTTYNLYKEYSGLCVEEKDYFQIINLGFVPNNLDNIFDGEFTCLRNGNVFEGNLDNKIINSGALVFLHDSTEKFCDSSKAYFFYKDFLVIVPVGELTYGSSPTRKNDSYNYYRYIKSNFKSIIVPISKIKKVSTLVNGRKYFIIIEYIDGKRDSVVLFEKWDNSMFSTVKELVPADNWTLFVNKKILKLSSGPINIQYIESHIKNNFDIIDNKINLLMSSSINFQKISDAIYKKFDASISYELDKLKYDNKEFLKFIIKNVSLIKDVKLKDIVDEYSAFLRSYNDKYKEMKDKYDKCLANYEKLSVFAKMKEKRNLEQSRINYNEFYNNGMEKLKSFEKRLFDYLILDDNVVNLDNDYVDNSVRFYLECLNKDITISDDKDQTLLFEMLYKKNGIDSFEKALIFYKDGKKNYNQSVIKKDKIVDSKKRMDYIISYNVEKEMAGILGYDKYLTSTIKEYEKSMNMASATGLLGELADLKSNLKAVRSDPYIFGGVANGIAGPVAGVMVANEIQRKNTESEINAKINSEKNKINANMANAMRSMYNSEAYSKNKEIKQILDKMCDMEHKDEYFKYLNCCINSYEIIDKDIIKINVKIKKIKDIILNNLNFILDGSLKINIILNDKVIGNAYLNAPGYDDKDLMVAGFNNTNDYEIIGMTDIDVSNCVDNLKFEFVPYHLWIIEYLVQVSIVGDISKSYLKIIDKLEEQNENNSKTIMMILKNCNRAVTPMEIQKFLPDKSCQMISATLIGMERKKYVVSEVVAKKTYYRINDNYINDVNDSK